jgi:MFS transporter, OFA family, oxalate/formate antiporter
MANANNQNLTKANFGPKGWAVCIYMFFIFYLNTSMNSGWQNCLSYWETTYGWDTTTLLSLVSVAQLIGVLACFVTGRLATKHSTRMLSLAWGVVVTVSCFVINLVHNMVLFGILECLAVMGQVVWAYTLNPIFVATWFPRKKGVVMGIVTIGVPLGAGTVSKIMNWIGATWGLNYCLYLPGLIGLIGILFLLFVVRDTPEEAGCTPDNDTSLTSEEVKRMAAERDEQDAKSPWTVGRMLKQKETYIVALCVGCCALFGGGFMGTNVLRMLAMGVQVGTAVNLMILTAAFACVASYFFGVVDGKFGPRIGILLVQIFAVAACILSALANGIGSYVCLVIGLALGGCVIGGAANFLTSLEIEYWGAANFKRANSVIYPIHQIPGSMGTLVVTQIAAHSGYATAYVVLAVVIAIAAAVLFTIKDGSFVKKAEAKWAAEGK